jgi:hypothetical protein
MTAEELKCRFYDSTGDYLRLASTVAGIQRFFTDPAGFCEFWRAFQADGTVERATNEGFFEVVVARA